MTSVWPGSYTDSRGREAISIQAAGTGLSAQIRGVLFTGADFDTLESPPTWT